MSTVAEQVQSPAAPFSPPPTRHDGSSKNGLQQARRDDSGLLKALWNYVIGGNTNNNSKSNSIRKGKIIRNFIGECTSIFFIKMNIFRSLKTFRQLAKESKQSCR